ncbi:glycosyl transferase [Desertivirga brevis]|uniref:glycosyl transferase n=1 Tax=Desertivirga brevis TaxID=2810310 RepID=UPI001A96E075|nr:glycosyl transferase [Pedobacter sp. SYSU D00873]
MSREFADFSSNDELLNFCTLFNSVYLSRGLALYNSLNEHCNRFHLYIIAFDDDCYNTLCKLRLDKATIIPLRNFEDKDLLTVKPTRTAGEYCWTSTSSAILYCINNFNLNHCTYLDADLLFFEDPRVLLAEMGTNSVLITEHRFTPEHDQSKNGKYCVQFVSFRSTPEGLRVLNWWRDACLEWCYNRVEDGKFGDQKYLDCWREKFEGVHELQHLGGGVAPWNVQQYEFSEVGEKIYGNEIKTGSVFQLIFYHFHDFRYAEANTFRLTAEHYFLAPKTIELIYRRYINELVNSEREIKIVNPIQRFNEDRIPLRWITKSLGRSLQFFIKGYYKNYFKAYKIA